MGLQPLYRLRFTYLEGWSVALEGGWEQHLYFADGQCDGFLSGAFKAANFPRRRTPEGPFCPDLRGVVVTDEGATVMVEMQGYGRAYPKDQRQVVASVRHLSDDDRYRRLNDVVCVCVGEVRAVEGSTRSPDLVIDVAELVWEPIAE